MTAGRMGHSHVRCLLYQCRQCISSVIYAPVSPFSLFRSPSIFLSLSPSPSPYRSLFFSPTLSLSLSLSIYIYIYIYLYLSHSLSFYLSPSFLSLFLSISYCFPLLFYFLSFYPYLPPPLSLYHTHAQVWFGPSFKFYLLHPKKISPIV